MESSQENAYDGVNFSKVRYLQCTDYNSATKRLLHGLFWNILRKPVVLKRIFWEKIQWWTSVLQSFDLLKHSMQTKNRVHARLFWRIAESFNIFTEKPPWWKLLFSKVAGLEFIPIIWFKKDSTAEVFEILENFPKDILTKHFLTKLEIIDWKDNLYIWMSMPITMPMPIPMPMSMPTCLCGRVAMANSNHKEHIRYRKRTVASYSSFNQIIWQNVSWFLS